MNQIWLKQHRQAETGIHWTGQFLRGSSGANVLEEKSEGKKEHEEGLERHGLMIYCSGQRKTSVMKLKDWQMTGSHGEKRDTPSFLIEDGTQEKEECMKCGQKTADVKATNVLVTALLLPLLTSAVKTIGATSD